MIYPPPCSGLFSVLWSLTCPCKCNYHCNWPICFPHGFLSAGHTLCLWISHCTKGTPIFPGRFFWSPALSFQWNLFEKHCNYLLVPRVKTTSLFWGWHSGWTTLASPLSACDWTSEPCYRQGRNPMRKHYPFLLWSQLLPYLTQKSSVGGLILWTPMLELNHSESDWSSLCSLASIAILILPYFKKPLFQNLRLDRFEWCDLFSIMKVTFESFYKAFPLILSRHVRSFVSKYD